MGGNGWKWTIVNTYKIKLFPDMKSASTNDDDTVAVVVDDCDDEDDD